MVKIQENPVKKYQGELAEGLKSAFGDIPVETEWITMRGEVARYSPRLDIAVGPFATGDARYGKEFNQLFEKHETLIRKLYELHCENLGTYGEREEIAELKAMATFNYNARCFLAIEIEHQSSRKHLMGGAINAAALGRFGIAIGWTKEKVRAFVKLRTYLLFLARVGKNSFNPHNLLVLSAEQMLAAIGKASAKPRKAQFQLNV